MHTAETTLKTLDHLWANYWLLGQQVDLDRMPSARIDELIRWNARVNPLRLAAWLATQSFSLSAWSLWEYYSRSLCEGLPKQVSEKQDGKKKTHVRWVADSLAANGKAFAEQAWFDGGNALRNLIAHHAARVVGPRAESLWKHAQPAFTDLFTDPQQYILITSDHASTLMWKVEEFIRAPENTAA